MNFEKEVFSKVLIKTDYQDNLEDIIRILKQNQINEVEILFGVGWGNEYKDWTLHRVTVDDILHEIRLAESLKVGEFGNDDFYIIVESLQTEILFCHERDIHLRYNEQNSIIAEILKLWQSKKIIRLAKTNSG